MAGCADGFIPNNSGGCDECDNGKWVAAGEATTANDQSQCDSESPESITL